MAHCFAFHELAVATHDFNDANLIGEGGFGRVYKGRLDSGETVAVKQLNLNGHQGNQEFIVEIFMLGLLRHSNLVTLIGYCADGDQRLLVYEYMPLGSLENHLFDLEPDQEPLDWHTRLKIAVGAARGLEYLHCKANPPVIYRDLKSANILLDNDFNPKLSDFGMAKLGPVGGNTHVSTRVIGTYGYCAPDYAKSGKLTIKSDIYSFGVVLLELITGRKAIDKTKKPGERNLVFWARPFLRDRKKFVQLVDPLLHGRFSVRSVHHVATITAMCLQEEANFRPLIVVYYLQKQQEEDDGEKNDPSSSSSSSSSLDTQCRRFSLAEIKQATNDFDDALVIGKGGFGKVYKEILTVLSTALMSSDAKILAQSFGNNKKDMMMEKHATKVVIAAIASRHMVPMSPSGKRMISSLKMFKFSELQRATLNFKHDRFLGEGAFGTVYKGWLDSVTFAPRKAGDGLAVAIKKSNPYSTQGFNEWRTEMEFLEKFSHPNVVKLFGYCCEKKSFLLVYEYLQNGSLDMHLFNEGAEPLPWYTRIKIAMGVASGLAFLHTTDNNIICRDNYNAKLSDFGLARLGPVNGESHVSTVIVGTYGYTAPEYLATGCLYVKSDVYSFGVMMLELITGVKVLDAIRHSVNHNLVDCARPFLINGEKNLIKIMDPRLEQCYPSKGASKAVDLIINCLEQEPKNRPSMEEVVLSLQAINEIKMKPSQPKAHTKN
ncbi:hypothetical protein M8C21_007459 [Ambrosia artemisiifolia]|uniref:non-specific serine/threonine protein kinase n=1 Tax=Ambrosia artemisiifolia TaxID=4212 RepID=A0AAD5CL93_AMBAR|nr:hypothetical protein M8C21_007459 [Ambrosia artemisiifolia]